MKQAMINKKTNGIKSAPKKSIEKESIIKIIMLVCFSALLAFIIQWDRAFSPEMLIGIFLIAILLLFIFYKDFMRYKPTFHNNYKLMFLVGVLLSGNLLIGRGFYYILISSAELIGNINSDLSIYAIPLAVGPMLAALLIDIHTAIVFSVITGLLAGVWLGNPLYSVFTFAAGLTAAFGVIRCKKRSALWKAGFFVGLVCMFTSLTITLLSGKFYGINIPATAVFAFVNGIIVTILVSAFLPLLEYLFKLSTDISLLELLDLNQPLMRNLLVMAPGTYHHSIIVGNLVEAAAEAVGVNPLLARVSAYYHDIGKVKMPDYFIENQTGLVSRHDKLTPHMSGLILISHVKEGVELAKQHKVPEAIIHIIQQHHGMSLITYFYQKAKNQDEDIAQGDFRYPGPKPQTRVAALVLMADAVEAASRVLTDPTPARISALIEKVINHFFIDGQLDDCELTLKDLNEIKKNFGYILTGMFHRRINYPGFDFKDGNSDKEQAKTQAVKHSEDKKSSQEDTVAHKTAGG